MQGQRRYCVKTTAQNKKYKWPIITRKPNMIQGSAVQTALRCHLNLLNAASIKKLQTLARVKRKKKLIIVRVGVQPSTKQNGGSLKH